MNQQNEFSERDMLVLEKVDETIDRIETSFQRAMSMISLNTSKEEAFHSFNEVLNELTNFLNLNKTNNEMVSFVASEKINIALQDIKSKMENIKYL